MKFLSNQMEYFNISHIIWLVLVISIVLSIFFIFRHRSTKAKKLCLICMCALNIVMYIPYKIVFCLRVPGSHILSELPLHLCSFNLILMPVAVATNNKKLFAYFLFVAAWASFAGMLFFGNIFRGMLAYDYVVISYFVYHTLLISISFMIPAFGFYKPKFSDIGWAYVFLVFFASIGHCINVVFRSTGICPTANYFVTMGDTGNIATDLLLSWIPVPLLYLLPVAVGMFGVSTGMYFLIKKIILNINNKKESAQGNRLVDTEELLKQ